MEIHPSRRHPLAVLLVALALVADGGATAWAYTAASGGWLGPTDWIAIAFLVAVASAAGTAALVLLGHGATVRPVDAEKPL